ncbi:hypothetical protein HDZ31DRAFT_60974 [Schizophyllum fasciatum]
MLNFPILNHVDARREQSGHGVALEHEPPSGQSYADRAMPFFDQPATIHVYEHDIHDADDWPDQVRGLVDVLLRGNDSAFTGASCPSPENLCDLDVETALPHLEKHVARELASAALQMSAGLAMMERRGQPQASGAVTWPYVCKLFAALWPGVELNAGALFALPIDPGQFDDPNARFMPPYMRADAILTRRLAIPEADPGSPPAPSGEEAMPLSDAQSQGGERDAMETSLRDACSPKMDCKSANGSGGGVAREGSITRSAGGEIAQASEDSYVSSYESSGDSPAVAASLKGTGDYPDECYDEQSDAIIVDDAFESVSRAKSDEYDAFAMPVDDAYAPDEQLMYEDSSLCFGEERSPLPHLHLLLDTDDAFLDFAFICAASPAKLYHTMASALLQRHAIGIVDPMVGIVFDTNSRLRLAFGWTEVQAGSDRVQVHVACSASAGQTSCRLATFDMHEPAEALRLAHFLALLREPLDRTVQQAETLLPSALVRPPRRWRLDLAGRAHSDPDTATLRDQIEAWRGAVPCGSSSAIREATTLRTGEGTSDTALSRTTATASLTSMSRTKKPASDASRITQSDATALMRNVPPREFKDDKVRFVDEDLAELKAVQCLLYSGAFTPQAASDFAKLGSQPRLRALAPRQVMLFNRRVIETIFPRSVKDIEMMPHLKPLRDVAYYFSPTKLPETIPDNPKHYQEEGQQMSLTNHLIQQYNAYVTKYDGIACDTRTDAIQPHKEITHAEKEHISRDLFTALPFLYETSFLAALAHWPSLLESEGRALCWDPLHKRFLKVQSEHEGLESFFRLEVQVKIPRNATLDSSSATIEPLRDYMRTQLRDLFPWSKIEKSSQQRCKVLQELKAMNKPGATLPPDVLDSLLTTEKEFPRNLTRYNNKLSGNYYNWEQLLSDEDARLSFLQEEPTRAKCDVVAGIKIPQVLTVEQGEKLNGVIELSNPQKQPPERKITIDSLFGDAKKAAERADPRGGLGRPDTKDLTELLMDRDDDPLRLHPEFERLWEERVIRPLQGKAAAGDVTDASMNVEPSMSQQTIQVLVDECLAFYMGEFKKENVSESNSQCNNQAFMDLESGVYKLASIGIYGCPVFCTAADGPRAVVFVAWGAKISDVDARPTRGPPVQMYIASRNPPKFDLTKFNQTVHFATFLLHLQHVHARRVAERFNKVRVALEERRKRDDPELHWTLEEQREERQSDLMDLLARQMEAFRILDKGKPAPGAGSGRQGSAKASTVHSGSPLSVPGSSGRTSAQPSSRPPSRAASSEDMAYIPPGAKRAGATRATSRPPSSQGVPQAEAQRPAPTIKSAPSSRPRSKTSQSSQPGERSQGSRQSSQASGDREGRMSSRVLLGGSGPVTRARSKSLRPGARR